MNKLYCSRELKKNRPLHFVHKLPFMPYVQTIVQENSKNKKKKIPLHFVHKLLFSPDEQNIV